MSKPEDKNHHAYVAAPPGTAPGWCCTKCGYRHIHPAAKRKCGTFIEHEVTAHHDFEPYAD